MPTLFIPNEVISGSKLHQFLNDRRVQVGGNSFLDNVVNYFHAPQYRSQEIIADGEDYRRMRKITDCMVRKYLQADIEGLADKSVKCWASYCKNAIHLGNMFDIAHFIIIDFQFRILFGEVPSADKRKLYIRFATNVHGSIKGTEIRNLGIRKPVYEDIRERIHGIQILQDYICEYGEKFVAKHIADLFFNVGVVQLSELISYGLGAATQHPEVMNRLNADRGSNFRTKYINIIIMESLRLYPLFGKTSRTVTETMDFEGLHISADTTVLLDFPAVHTSTEWENPSEFKPERWERTGDSRSNRASSNGHYIPFGLGPRRCPAKGLALRSANAILGALFNLGEFSVPDQFVHTRRIPRGVPVVLRFSSANHIGLRLKAPGPETESRVQQFLAQKPKFQLEDIPWGKFSSVVTHIIRNIFKYRNVDKTALFMLVSAGHVQLLRIFRGKQNF